METYSRFFRGANVMLGNWRQVTVQREILYGCLCEFIVGHTRISVQSPLVALDISGLARCQNNNLYKCEKEAAFLWQQM